MHPPLLSNSEKVVFIFVVRRPVPSKMVTGPKNYCLWLLWKLLFFPKKLLNEKYSKPQCLRKRLPLPSKRLCSPTNGFSQFFSKILLSKNLFYNKISVQDKKGYINFLRKTFPFPKKWLNASPRQFLAVSLENTAFFFEKIV